MKSRTQRKFRASSIFPYQRALHIVVYIIFIVGFIYEKWTLSRFERSVKSCCSWYFYFSQKAPYWSSHSSSYQPLTENLYLRQSWIPPTSLGWKSLVYQSKKTSVCPVAYHTKVPSCFWSDAPSQKRSPVVVGRPKAAEIYANWVSLSSAFLHCPF